jgi:hypothetical protein
MTRLVLWVALFCALVVLTSAYPEDGDETAPTPQTKASTSLQTVANWINKRAAKMKARLQNIVTQAHLAALNGEAPNDCMEVLVTGVVQFIDTATQVLEPESADIKAVGSTATEKAEFAAVETFHETIKPDETLAQDPDSEIDKAAQDARTAEETAMPFAAKLLTRADAAASPNENPVADAPDKTPLPNVSFFEMEEMLEKSHKSKTSRVFNSRRRRRRRTPGEVSKAISDAVQAETKNLSLFPDRVGVAIGGHALARGKECEATFDFKNEELATAVCDNIVLGTDTFGVGGEYKFSLGWGRSKAIANSDAEYAAAASVGAGVSDVLGLVKIGLSGSITVGLSSEPEGWSDVQTKQGSALPSPGNNKPTNVSDEGKGFISKLRDAAVSGVKSAISSNGSIVFGLAVTGGMSTLPVFGVEFNVAAKKCQVKKAALGEAHKFWKMITVLFLTSGPGGALVGALSWAAHHADLIATWLTNMINKLKAASKAAAAAIYEGYVTAKQDIGTAFKKFKSFFSDAGKAFKARLISSGTELAVKVTKFNQALTNKIRNLVRKIGAELSTLKNKAVYTFVPEEAITKVHYFTLSAEERITALAG